MVRSLKCAGLAAGLLSLSVASSVVAQGGDDDIDPESILHARLFRFWGPFGLTAPNASAANYRIASEGDISAAAISPKNLGKWANLTFRLEGSSPSTGHAAKPMAIKSKNRNESDYRPHCVSSSSAICCNCSRRFPSKTRQFTAQKFCVSEV